MRQLDQVAVTELKGVGPKVAEKLARLGIASLQDLLYHLPHRYEDRTRIYPIGSLQPGQHVSIEGTVDTSRVVFGRRSMLIVRLSDASGGIALRFFHFSAAQHRQLNNGRRLRCFGEVRRGQHGLEMSHPEYRYVGDDEPAGVEEAMTPVYPTTEGLRQVTLRSLTDQALGQLRPGVLRELLPEGLYPQQITLTDALATLHRPPADLSASLLEEGRHPAQLRLIIEELLAHQLGMLRLRQSVQHHAARPLTAEPDLEARFLQQLPFSPTGAQVRVVAEIEADLRAPRPMMRLVQGDVGSGKTLVAALAALRAIGNGCQVALMAPTELLAEQHAANFRAWLEPLGVPVAWLAGKLKGKGREQTLAAIASGEAAMVVGTHALFQESVQFHELALVIIDEQHRFGVHQRLSLRDKGSNGANGRQVPHQLIMTATPIPRTLAMTAYADLDTSIIDELPPGRTPVTTVAVPDLRRDEVIERVRRACREGRQAYWVCTLIEESEVLQCQAAEDTASELQAKLTELRIGLVHGRMKAAEKQAVMAAFKAGELDLLVATTVIEVGVDVPNASLMIIENPERLGLAQLHQLRGRVGRGAVASHCVLLYKTPLSKTAIKRLGVLRESNDGFVIAQRDLEIRGPGELLGTKQTGLVEMKIADLVRDQHLVPEAQRMAQRILRDFPEHVDCLIDRWLPESERVTHA